MDISVLQVEFARKLLENSLSFFDESMPENMTPGTAAKIQELKRLTEETVLKLKCPTLRLAFIGATSSGKSTLVNALIGHAIVPMEAAEMSAGIVKLFDEKRSTVRLRIHPPALTDESHSLDDLWSGFEGEISDEEAYDKLSSIMLKYHELKKECSNLIAPETEIQLHNQLSCEGEIKLPDGVKLEIIDLPGIREIDDKANLEVVQESLKRSVLFVVLNYEDTSGERLQVLLKEVKEVIDIFKSTNTVFFVLNKVDRWTNNDVPLSKKLENLRKDISPIVQMNANEIDISPLNSLQLFLYSAGYGVSGTQELSDKQIIYLTTGIVKANVFSEIDDDDTAPDCCSAQTLKKISALAERVEKGCTDAGRELDPEEITTFKERLANEITYFRKNYLQVFLDNEIREQLLARAKEKSGGKALLGTLSKRIQDHFPQLVIQPAVHDWQVLAEQVLNLVEANRAIVLASTKKNIDSLVNKLNETQTKLSATLTEIQKEISRSLSIFTTNLRDGQYASQTKAINAVKNNEYLSSLADIIGVLETL